MLCSVDLRENILCCSLDIRILKPAQFIDTVCSMLSLCGLRGLRVNNIAIIVTFLLLLLLVQHKTKFDYYSSHTTAMDTLEVQKHSDNKEHHDSYKQNFKAEDSKGELSTNHTEKHPQHVESKTAVKYQDSQKPIILTQQTELSPTKPNIGGGRTNLSATDVNTAAPISQAAHIVNSTTGKSTPAFGGFHIIMFLSIFAGRDLKAYGVQQS